jgi:hypothetical protein
MSEITLFENTTTGTIVPSPDEGETIVIATGRLMEVDDRVWEEMDDTVSLAEALDLCTTDAQRESLTRTVTFVEVQEDEAEIAKQKAAEESARQQAEAARREAAARRRSDARLARDLSRLIVSIAKSVNAR